MLFEKEFYDTLKNKLIELSIKKTSKHENKLSILCKEVNKRFGFPLGMVSDVVTLRVAMEDTSEELLYAIAKTLNANINLDRYFAAKTIETYDKYRYDS